MAIENAEAGIRVCAKSCYFLGFEGKLIGHVNYNHDSNRKAWKMIAGLEIRDLEDSIVPLTRGGRSPLFRSEYLVLVQLDGIER